MKNLSCKQLHKVCMNYRFLMLRYSTDNSTISVNCKIARLTVLSKFKSSDQPTKFISYKPLGFMEYISNKVPFMVIKD